MEGCGELNNTVFTLEMETSSLLKNHLNPRAFVAEGCYKAAVTAVLLLSPIPALLARDCSSQSSSCRMGRALATSACSVQCVFFQKNRY